MNPNYIRSRLADYQNHDIEATRAELVRRWREAHPEAAKEASAYLHPLIQIVDNRSAKLSGTVEAYEPDEVWGNDVYNVALRRHEVDSVFGTNDGVIQLGIGSLDGTARHDWRDMQAIKNQLAGPDVEAFELYPAEYRLWDPSNYFTLWCFPGIRRIKVGLNERKLVLDSDFALSPQRSLPFGPNEELVQLRAIDNKRSQTCAELIDCLAQIAKLIPDELAGRMAWGTIRKVHADWQVEIDETKREDDELAKS